MSDGPTLDINVTEEEQMWGCRWLV